MSRLFYHVMQDNVGNLLFDVSGTMRLAGTGTLATIYGDEELTVILPNPMTNHASFGSFKCFLGAGDYDFYMAKAGYTFETLTGVQGHGTMAQQDATAVAIMGGTAALSNAVLASATITTAVITAANLTTVGVHTGPASGVAAAILHNKAGGEQGLVIGPGPGQGDGVTAYEIMFNNSSGVGVGAISTTATATTYATSSDQRLKRAVTALAGALAVVQALRPVAFRWNSTDEADIGFLAHELMTVAPNAVTGQPDEVNPDGSIKPQQVDHSKLIPLLTAGLKELLARVAALEEAML